MESFKPMTLSAPYPGTPAKQPLFSAIDEKLDTILKYQKRAAHMAVFRAIISFIFFLVFIVLPLIGTYYLYDYMKNSGLDFQKISEQYKGAMDTMGKLKETTDQIGDLKSAVTTQGIQKLIDVPKK